MSLNTFFAVPEFTFLTAIKGVRELNLGYIATIHGCVMGGVCITLYGFIAVSGLKMIQKVDLEDHANLFTVSVILICGIGGMSMQIGKISITTIACALIMGIFTNIILHRKKPE